MSAQRKGDRGGGNGGKEKSEGVILMIGIFKLAKVVLLITAGIGAFKLVNENAGHLLTRVASHLHVDPHNRWLNEAISHVTGVDPKKLELVGVATFLYAAVFAIEGVGLVMRKRWAEYMTAIVTTSFIPIEIYEMVHHATAIKAVTIALNVAIVVYLVLELKRQRKEDREKKSGDSRTCAREEDRPAQLGGERV